MQHGVRRVEWRAHGGHGLDHLLQLRPSGGLERRGAAEGVAHEQLRGLVIGLQPLGGGDNIVHVLGERGVLEFTLGLAQAREVESQGGDAVLRQLLGNARCAGGVAGSGEAMGKDCVGLGGAVRAVDGAGHHVALRRRDFHIRRQHG